MKKTILILSALTSFSLAGKNVGIPTSEIIAIEEPINISYYIGIGLSGFYLKNDLSKEEFKSYAGLVLGGINLNKYVSIEGRYYKSFGDMEYYKGNTGNINYDDFPGTFSDYSAFLKLKAPYKSFEPYLLVGYGEVNFDSLPYLSGRSERSEAGFQYGLGASYNFTNNISTFIDYTKLYDGKGFDGRALNADVSIDTFNIGFSYKF